MTEKFPIDLKIQLNYYDVGVIREYARKVKECYLEIGTNEGGSALIARTATDKPIYTIDNKNVVKIPTEQLNINFINKSSEEAVQCWKLPIDVLFIDGDHTKAYQDFLLWQKYLVKGGYILIHDYIPEEETITVKKDCEPILTDNRFKKLFIPNFGGDGTRILQLQKL